MSIHIKNINVKDLGPISKLTWNLDDINLIYGGNEKGKSYLVEFIIRCLFKTSGWNLRDEKGIGKIEVVGLSDETIDFTPDSSKKLEDFLTDRYIGLPPDFSKLLVLRGTNVELGKEDESDKIMLRRYLSHKEILNAIIEDIQVTVKDCDISEYTITGADRGNLRTRNELESKLKRIENLFIEVGNKFLSGEMKTLENKKKSLSERHDNLEKAKRCKAFQLSEEIKKLEEEADKIYEEKIDELISNVNKLKSDKREFLRDKQELKELRESTRYYEWLDKVIEEYVEYNLNELTPKPSKWYPISLIGIVIATGTLIAFGFKWFGFVLLFVLAGVVYFYVRKILNYIEDDGKREELQNLKEDFRDRFGQEFNNLAEIKEKKENMGKAYNKKEVLGERLVEKKKYLNIFKSSLSEEISDILREKFEEDKWKEKLIEEKEKKRELEREISDTRSERSGLQVDKEDYLRSKPEVEFDSDEYKEVEEELGKIEDEIQQKKSELESLKHSLIEHTEDEITIGWMELIENLASKREEVLKEYKDITSEIIADKNVYDVISELYEEEDEKIHNALDSDIIKETLPKVTMHYNNIYLENENLIVSGKFKSFSVSNISDGAKEQVFLALRIGFAKHWFKKDELFLILDDAFLHSDYNRRPLLLDKLIELANSGWQIICFTFDDNIRNLIDKKVKKLKCKYRFYNLNEI